MVDYMTVAVDAAKHAADRVRVTHATYPRAERRRHCIETYCGDLVPESETVTDPTCTLCRAEMDHVDKQEF